MCNISNMDSKNPKLQEALKMLEEAGSFSKTEQHFLVCLRLRGMIEGKEGMGIYKGKSFFKSMKSLVDAGWASKKVRMSNSGKSCSYYVLTSKGMKFNAMMMKHCAYKPIWDRMEHKIAIGERII
jgi:hypothetical protein